MTRRRRRTGGRYTPPRSLVDAIGLASADARGCRCEPELRLTHPAPGVSYLAVAHDDWCPALDRAAR